MGRITLYLPKQLEETIKKEARKTQKTVSSYVTEILSNKLVQKKWSKAFLNICGSCEGEFPEIKKLRP